VPYTGIGPMEATLDVTGPMTANVRDNALLLQVLAGSDGLDPRQKDIVVNDYSAGLGKGVKGLRIGVVKEGFGHHNSQADVDARVRDAAKRFSDLGASVEEVTIPLHSHGYAIWAAIRGDPAAPIWLAMNGGGAGHEGLHLTSLMQAVSAWRQKPDDFVDTVKIAAIFSRYAFDKYGGHFYAKAQNVRRRLRAIYDAELARYDLLLMPTVPFKAPPIPGPNASPQEITRESWGPTRNTCPFNVTGHPAISIPCGLSDGLPIGVMLVARHFDEATIYQAAEAFEASGDWKTF
jgi:amidase